MEKQKTENKSEENKRREKLLELQTLDAKIKQIEDGLVNIENQIIEINLVIECIKEISNVKPDSEALVPLANGIFIKAKIADTQMLKVNIGSNTVVEKSNEETQQMLKDQLKSIEEYKDELMRDIQKLVNQASIIQADIMGDE